MRRRMTWVAMETGDWRWHGAAGLKDGEIGRHLKPHRWSSASFRSGRACLDRAGCAVDAGRAHAEAKLRANCVSLAKRRQTAPLGQLGPSFGAPPMNNRTLGCLKEEMMISTKRWCSSGKFEQVTASSGEYEANAKYLNFPPFPNVQIRLSSNGNEKNLT